MSSLRSDSRTSGAVRGSGWVGNSPQAEQLLAQLAPGERVELLFTTLRFQGALTPRRLLLWRGTFKVEHTELRRPLTVLESGSQSRFGEVVVLDGPEGAIELKMLSAAVFRAVVAAGRQRERNVPADPLRAAQGHRGASETPGVHRAGVGRASTPPRAEEGTGSPKRGFRARTIRTWQDAELAAVDHMHGLGFTDAQVTGPGADGGVDVIAWDAIAQVKYHSQPIGVGPVRELRGVADPHHHLLFYASGGYTASARQFADEKKVALFSIQEFGHITPLNPAAAQLSHRQAPTAGRSRTTSSRAQVPNPRATQRAAELEAQRQTVLRLITRVRAHTSEVQALPSNRYTKDLIKALKAADKLIERADSLLARSRADFQPHRGRKQLIAMADEKAREAALKLGMRA
ncbi:restriction endonuclease [Streptomyces sp. NPDC006465]|uniref:restriction endonuclease n=1 Tax=Streptomyces sp. NPDC006465 TaxID=3157174 RepID=UPI0033BE7389